MRLTILALLCLLFVSCAQTPIYDRGRLVACIQGDASNVTIKTPTLYFHADALNHSAATRASTTAIAQMAGGVGSFIISILKWL